MTAPVRCTTWGAGWCSTPFPRITALQLALQHGDNEISRATAMLQRNERVVPIRVDSAAVFLDASTGEGIALQSWMHGCLLPLETVEAVVRYSRGPAWGSITSTLSTLDDADLNKCAAHSASLAAALQSDAVPSSEILPAENAAGVETSDGEGSPAAAAAARAECTARITASFPPECITSYFVSLHQLLAFRCSHEEDCLLMTMSECPFSLPLATHVLRNRFS